MATNSQNETQQQFSIQRIYVKDLSFEAPAAPEVFQKEWKPEMHLDIQTQVNDLKNDLYEIVLTLTVTVKNEDNNAFLAEVKQAGIFLVKNFPEENMDHTLKAFCPSVLYPYAREVITDVVTRGSFPQLILAPINFEAFYAKHKEQQQA